MTTEPGPRYGGGLPMSDAEFRCLRDHLGLTMEWLADYLDVAERTIRRWEAGVSPVPDGVATEMLRLAELTGHIVEECVETFLDMPEPRMVTYRTDEDFKAGAHDQASGLFPASWHRALCARVAGAVPDLRIRYWTSADGEDPGPVIAERTARWVPKN